MKLSLICQIIFEVLFSQHSAEHYLSTIIFDAFSAMSADLE